MIGATDPEGKADPTNPVSVGGRHSRDGDDGRGHQPEEVIITPIGRTVKFSEGEPIAELLS